MLLVIHIAKPWSPCSKKKTVEIYRKCFDVFI